MPDLEMLLRDVRPAPDPAWAAQARRPRRRRLSRAAAALEGAAAWRSASTCWRSARSATVASLLIVVVVVAASGSTPRGDSASGRERAAPGGPRGERPSGPQTQRRRARAPPGSAPDATPVARRAGRAGAATRRPEQRHDHAVHARPTGRDVIDRAIRVVDGLGGFVETSEVNRERLPASATLTLRIPSGKLDSGLAQLSEARPRQGALAAVPGRHRHARALEAPVRDARADRDGLRTRLARRRRQGAL